MAQWIKVFATKPDSLSSNPTPDRVEGEDDSCKLSSDLHICTHACAHVPTYTPSHTKCDQTIVFSMQQIWTETLNCPDQTLSLDVLLSEAQQDLCVIVGKALTCQSVFCWSCHLTKTPIAWNALKPNLATWRVSSVFHKCGLHSGILRNHLSVLGSFLSLLTSTLILRRGL